MLLKLGLGSLATSSLALPLRAMAGLDATSAPDLRQWFFSAVDNGDGQHFLAGVRHDASDHFLLPVAERCHGGCLRPGHPQTVLFARRPGTQMHVIDPRQRQPLHVIEAGEGYHYYGHGVFEPSGRWLYVTANRIDDAMGLIRVHDAEADYAWHQDFELAGIGPHEIALMPDGKTLTVALGGIRTHPDMGRIKLNLDDMDPALLLVDRHSGEVVERHRPSHHQLSCRHLDIGPEGEIIAGYQFQGPAWETQHPLIARRSTNGEFDEVSLPETVQTSLASYTASIAVSHKAPTALITAPRGGRIVLIQRNSGELLASPELEDAAGARCDGRGGYLVTSGNGQVCQLDTNGELTTLADLPLRWDNHLT
ncbi:hypothetical protein BJB45_15555 [Halomonas huangheensis]|uniref:DUF1513 domain-containing protein n=2 Tax=Halomonas huangheensis TaxID=1178482 RepID=W1NAY8_9GAMM|nr:hypothetical protein BJB45_15555 [Halomonas huangheensis]